MNIFLIDNYDSFTYNLRQMLEEAGAEVCVKRNDCFDLDEIQRFDKIVLSPGPGIPDEAGLLKAAIKAYAGQKPILGVCLGHQAIGEVFGATLVNLPKVFHGVQTSVHIVAQDALFADVSAMPAVGRYHSWAVAREGFPACLEVTAESDDGCIMALRHRDYAIHGIQFHPESVLTPEGFKMIQNFIQL